MRLYYIIVDMKSINKDTHLLTALQKGDVTAFECIFKEYYPILCAYGSRFVEYEEAKEIAGDVLLWLWEHRQTFQTESPLGKYLLKSVYHRSLNSIKQKNRKNLADTMFYEEMESIIQDIDPYHLTEISKRIKEAIKALPESYRETFILHRFTRMSHKEIADKFKISAKTVAYRIQQATKLLRKDLSDLLFVLSVLFDYSW